MKKNFNLNPVLALSLLFILIGCGNNNNAGFEKLKMENKKLQIANKSILNKLENVEIDHENLKIKYSELEEWSTALANQYGESIWFFSEYDKPLPQESVNEATPQMLIDKLNKLFIEAGDPEVIIEKITDNAIDVSISNEDKLTQNMGTSGAAGYISSVVYTLTSIESIKCIYFNFKEEGHAFPGKYCR